MINPFVTIATLAVLSTPSVAATTGYEFYNNTTGYWHVGGYSGDEGGLNPACYAEYQFQDGSIFQLIKDLETGELYIWSQNMEWNISDQPGQYTMRLNLVGANGDISPASGNYTYELINKNTIVISGLNIEEFTPEFMTTMELRFMMPGDIPNAYIPLQGSYDATALIAECIDKSSQVKLNF